MNLPNLITLARLLSVPAIVWLILERHWLGAFAVFAAAGASDAVDGIVARQFNRQTRLGAYLDPLADKALLVAVYVTLAVVDQLPNWLAIVVLSRDILIVGGVMLAHAFGTTMAVRPSLLSKANTCAQIVLVAVVLAGIAFAVPALLVLAEALIWLVAASTLASGLGYLVQWLRQMGDIEERP